MISEFYGKNTETSLPFRENKEYNKSKNPGKEATSMLDPANLVFHTGSAVDAPLEHLAAREMLDELFTHSDAVSDTFFQELRDAGVLLPAPPVRVVTITPGPGNGQFSMSDAAGFAGIAAHRLPELVRNNGIFFYRNSCIQGIVNAAGEAGAKALYDGLRQLVSEFPDRDRPHGAISNVYEDLRFISRALEENREAQRFERFLTRPIDVVVQPQDFFLYGGTVPEDEEDEVVFGRLSQQICNALTVDDHALMHRALDEALDYMVGKFPRVSGVHMRAIHFCTPLEMALVGADLIDRQFVQQFRLVQRVIETDTEEQLRETFHRQLDLLAEQVVQRRKLHDAELMHRVVDYISDNFSDCMLSLPSIARHFQMAEPRLSAAFRTYYQATIPEVIHQRRIQFLKQQLRTTRTPVRQLARAAGYVSVATMNRAFLRLEGVYPGQYRKQHQNTPDDAS
jgi:AraC-like DNA-binding protein